MSEKFHNYNFKIKEMSSKDSSLEYLKIKVISKKLDDEAYLYSTNGSGDYSLYLEDRFFNFSIDNSTKNVSAFQGDLNLKNLKIVKLQLPKTIKDAILYLDTKDDLQSGCGGYIHFNADKIYYDADKKILQIGNIDLEEATYKFFYNGFTQLKEDKITGLLFTDLEL